MYRLTSDYHTHTTMSHGVGTVEENILSAIDQGLEGVGISDHGTGHLSYGIRNLSGYLDEIARMKEKYRQKIKVFAAIELNLISLNGKLDLLEEYAHQFDYTIFGFHQFARMADVSSFLHFYLARYLFPGKKFISKTTAAYIKAIASGKVSILAHPGYAVALDIPAVAAACREYGVLFELNNSHSGLSETDIEKAANQGVKFVLSSDAHSPDKVGNIERALEKALNAGLTEEQIINLEKITEDKPCDSRL